MAALVTAEKRQAAAPNVAKDNTVYSRTFDILVPASTTAATYDLTGIEIPPGTYLLGVNTVPRLASTRAVTTMGTSVFGLATVTDAQTFVSSTTNTLTAEKMQTIAAGTNLLHKSSATANNTLQLIIGTATTPANAMVIETTLILACVGSVVGRQASVGN